MASRYSKSEPGDVCAQLLILAFIESQARQTRRLVINMNMPELLRGIEIRDIGLQEMVAANITRLGGDKIETLWDLVNRGSQTKIRECPLLGINALEQILTQLAVLGLTLPE